MTAHIYNQTGIIPIGQIEVEPICGQSFCDNCGDCLACYGGDACPDGTHRWVLYIDEYDKWPQTVKDAWELKNQS